MSKFRKKPVVIEAVRFLGLAENAPIFEGEEDAPAWLGVALQDKTIRPVAAGGLVVVTLEGTMGANVGDWIIRGVTGELYPCKPFIFEATYDPVEG